MLLALDTASAAVGVALADGGSVLAARASPPSGKHAESLVVPLVDTVLTEAGARLEAVTVVAVGVGPGPFTGLRVGLVTARVLGATLGVPVHGVCSLDVVAHGAVRRGTVPAGSFTVATDARRREVYWAAYEAGPTGGRPPWRRIAGPDVAAPADVPGAGPDGGPRGPVAGRGAALYPDLLGDPREPLDPDAADLADLAGVLLAAGAPMLPPEPLYLRRPDARAPGARKRVLR